MSLLFFDYLFKKKALVHGILAFLGSMHGFTIALIKHKTTNFWFHGLKY